MSYIDLDALDVSLAAVHDQSENVKNDQMQSIFPFLSFSPSFLFFPAITGTRDVCMQGEEPEVRCDYGKKCGLGKKKRKKEGLLQSHGHILEMYHKLNLIWGKKKNPPSLRTQLSKCTKKRKCTNLSKGSPDVFLKT